MSFRIRLLVARAFSVALDYIIQTALQNTPIAPSGLRLTAVTRSAKLWGP